MAIVINVQMERRKPLIKISVTCWRNGQIERGSGNDIPTMKNKSR